MARPSPAVAQLLPAPPVCSFWLQGRCNRNPCRFSHPPVPAVTDDPLRPSSHTNPPQRPARRRILRRPIFEVDKFSEDAHHDGDHDQKQRVFEEGSICCAPAPAEATLIAPQTPPRRHFHRPIVEADIVVEDASHLKPHIPDGTQYLPTAVQSTLITCLAGHQPGSSIRGIAMPRSSACLFSAGQDGLLRGWDRATGLCTQLLSLGQPANCLFNSFDDPNWLFVGLATEVRVINLALNTQQSLPVAFPVLSLTSLGDLLLAGSEQGSILVWKFDAASAAFVPVAALSPTDERLMSAVLTLEPASSTAKMLLSGHADGTLRVWDLGTTGECMDSLQAHHGAVNQVISCGDNWVLSASHADCKISLWRICSQGLQTSSSTTSPDHAINRHLLELSSTHIVRDADQGLRPIVMCGVFDKDNTPLLFASYNNSTVHILEVPSFTEMGVIQCIDQTPIQAMEICAPNLLILGGSDGSLAVWSWSKQNRNEDAEASRIGSSSNEKLQATAVFVNGLSSN